MQAALEARGQPGPPRPPTLAFEKGAMTVQEGCQTAILTVIMTTPSKSPVTVLYETVEVTATAGEDFEATSGLLKFAPGQTSKEIKVNIIDDDVAEDDETFHVVLSEPNGAELSKTDRCVRPAPALRPSALYTVLCMPRAHASVAGPRRVFLRRCVVTIEDDDMPGELDFVEAMITCAESVGKLQVKVKRSNGSKGSISCEYATRDGTAVAPSDYEAISGTLTFPSGVVEQTIEIDIVDDAYVPTPLHVHVHVHVNATRAHVPAQSPSIRASAPTVSRVCVSMVVIAGGTRRTRPSRSFSPSHQRVSTSRRSATASLIDASARSPSQTTSSDRRSSITSRGAWRIYTSGPRIATAADNAL